MRILVNGREVPTLEPDHAARLRNEYPDDPAQGELLTAAEAVEQAQRRMRILFGVLGGGAGALLLAVLWGAVSYEPGILTTVGPVYAVCFGAVGLLIWFLWRRTTAQTETRAAAQAALMPAAPGEIVRVDASGLTVGAAHYAWAGLRIEEASITSMDIDDAKVEVVERLSLSSADRTLVLDAVMLNNGRKILGRAWRWLCAQHGF